MSFHNAVTVARAGLGEPDVPQAAELVTSARGDGYAYTATRLPHYNHTAWTRHLLWLPGRYTFAWDELTAEEAGEYSFVLGWRSLGQPSLRPGRFISAQDERKQAGLVFDGPALVKSVSANSGKVLYLLSGYNALFYRADQPGDFVEVVVKVPQAAEYEPVIRTLRFSGRATVQTSLDGRPLGPPLDLYMGGGPQVAEAAAGKVALTAGEHRLRFEVVGKNPASAAYTFAIDRSQSVVLGVDQDPLELVVKGGLDGHLELLGDVESLPEHAAHPREAPGGHRRHHVARALRVALVAVAEFVEHLLAGLETADGVR